MVKKRDGSDRMVDVVLEPEEKPGIAEKIRVPPKDVQEALRLYMGEIAEKMSLSQASLSIGVPGVGQLNLSCSSGRGELALNSVWLVEVGEEVVRRLAPKIQKYLEAEAERLRLAREQNIKDGEEYQRRLNKVAAEFQPGTNAEPNLTGPEGGRVVYARETPKAQQPCDTDSPSPESDKT